MKNHISITSMVYQLMFAKYCRAVTFKLQLFNLNLKSTLKTNPLPKYIFAIILAIELASQHSSNLVWLVSDAHAKASCTTKSNFMPSWQFRTRWHNCAINLWHDVKLLSCLYKGEYCS